MTDLRRMKWRATGLLIVATVVYFVMRAVADRTGWQGFVEATAEAAMVGGLADWFAVTALFRHPLGLPIPHTAIVPNRKDTIGRSLGDFVQQNFLDGDLVAERLERADIATRLGDWLVQPANARAVGRQAGGVVLAAIDVLNDDDVQAGIEAIVAERVMATPVAPMVGRVVDFAVEGEHHQAIFDSMLRGLAQVLGENQGVLRMRLAQESPWWVPEPVDDRVFERLFIGMQAFLSDLSRDRHHPLRRNLEARIAGLAHELRSSPDLLERGEHLKGELLAHPAFREWTDGLWSDLKAGIVRAAKNPESEMYDRLTEAAQAAGVQLRNDPALRVKVDRWIVTAARGLATHGQAEVSDFIAGTIERWDADETSELIELQVGRDLQFIRINGTLVGGLAGFVIHLISTLFF
ncbi:MAG: DUF445 domain-containing protein [Acidimicrobiales bacterium]|nr:DUF445 domain-containing protein [Acidimicrobiales bacterium]